MADGDGTVGLVENDAADGQVGVRAAGGFPEALAETRFEGVIAVEESQVFARGRFDATVSGGSRAGIGLGGCEAELFGPGIFRRFPPGSVHAVVRPVVIDQNDFKVIERLGKYRVQTGFDVCAGVVNGDDQGHVRHGQRIFLRASRRFNL